MKVELRRRSEQEQRLAQAATAAVLCAVLLAGSGRLPGQTLELNSANKQQSMYTE
jgi:hypothetical protein